MTSIRATARFLPLLLLLGFTLAACRPQPPGPGKVGQKMEYDGYAITIATVEFADDFPGARKARDGFTLAVLDVIVESNRAKDVTFRPKYAALTDRDGVEHAARASGRGPSLDEFEDLPKGQSRRGWLTFEVARNARKFQFVYDLPPALNNAQLKVDIER